MAETLGESRAKPRWEHQFLTGNCPPELTYTHVGLLHPEREKGHQAMVCNSQQMLENSSGAGPSAG